MIGITDDVDWNHLAKEHKADTIGDRVKEDPNDISQAGGKPDAEIIQNHRG